MTVWTYDPSISKLVGQDAQLGALQRNVRSLTVDSADQYAYAGTTSGDVLQVSGGPWGTGRPGGGGGGRQVRLCWHRQRRRAAGERRLRWQRGAPGVACAAALWRALGGRQRRVWRRQAAAAPAAQAAAVGAAAAATPAAQAAAVGAAAAAAE